MPPPPLTPRAHSGCNHCTVSKDCKHLILADYTDADGEVTKAEFMRMLAADGGGGGGGGGGGEAKGDSEGGGDAARNEHAPL